MTLDSGITLFTSDSRPKYANDALGVVALPVGSEYQFRYEGRYLPVAVKHAFDRGIIGNVQALVAFRAQQLPEKKTPFIVPLRWVDIVGVERVSDFYTMRFVAGGYPTLVSQSEYLSLEGIRKVSASYIQSQSEDTRGLPVHIGLTSLADNKKDDDRECWMKIARALALHEAFYDTHILKVSPLRDIKGRPINKGSNAFLRKTNRRGSSGDYCLREHEYGYFSVDYYASQFTDKGSKLEISCDDECLKLGSRAIVEMDSRYDSIECWVHAAEVRELTRSEIRLETTDSKSEVENDIRAHVHTAISIPVVVRREARNLLGGIAISAIGATLVAMPGIIGTGGSMGLRATLAGAGAIILAVAVNIFGRNG